ncbi:hypothetical protein BDW02DRAFT_571686 [Decorospora gaudefroyi]|uniref:Uncharacterized protein n=1 Tax=Decorospora gaudefroyi TaxID=184978 RepID=A0A6A5K288_9PLEO|nr:hypothetical protein BDW02DRAFT_571686 [Decorospora gaudefroyi]
MLGTDYGWRRVTAKGPLCTARPSATALPSKQPSGAKHIHGSPQPYLLENRCCHPSVLPSSFTSAVPFLHFTHTFLQTTVAFKRPSKTPRLPT